MRVLYSTAIDPFWRLRGTIFHVCCRHLSWERENQKSEGKYNDYKNYFKYKNKIRNWQNYTFEYFESIQ